MPSPLTEGPSPADATIGVILIHGRGASAASMLGLAETLGVADVHYRAPQAEGWSWYPNSFLAPLAANEPGISNGMQTLSELVADLEGEGLPAERIVLLGFSQGACLASEYAARHPRRFGGIVALSGGLIGNVQREDGAPPDDKGFEYEGSLEGTPAFVGCSDVDPHIPIDRVRTTAEVLESLHADVDLRIYRGMGHTVNNDELEAVKALLQDAAAD